MGVYPHCPKCTGACADELSGAPRSLMIPVGYRDVEVTPECLGRAHPPGRCPLVHGAHLGRIDERGGVAVRGGRLRTGAAKRFKKAESATAVIWKTLGVAEQRFRRLDAPELLPDVAEGVMCLNGERVKRGNEEKAAA